MASVPIPDGERWIAAMRCSASTRNPGSFMSVGVFFVEYQRTRGGHADVLAKLSRAWERTASGVTFEQAFEESFGRSLADMEADFVTFLGETEGKPEERLRGTPYEAFLPGIANETQL